MGATLQMVTLRNFRLIDVGKKRVYLIAAGCVITGIRLCITEPEAAVYSQKPVNHQKPVKPGTNLQISVNNYIILLNESLLNAAVDWAAVLLDCFTVLNPDPTSLKVLNENMAKVTNGKRLPNIILAGDFNLPSIDWENNEVRSPAQYRGQPDGLGCDE